jgi:HEAT repeat protein
MYKRILERPEEHLQCAALVGLGRIGSAEAAQAVFAKLKSPERKVRITAAQVWARFAA